MAVKTVSVPVAWSMSREVMMSLRESGRLGEVKEKQDKLASLSEAELNEALGSGYTVVASHLLEVSEQTYIVFTLYKADGE